MCCCVLHNCIKLQNRGDPLFNRYRVDGVMLDADSDDEDDALSSSGSSLNQGGCGGNDDNLATKFGIISCSKCI